MNIERFFAPEAAHELGLIEEIKREHVYLRAAGRSKFLVTTMGIYLAKEAKKGLSEIATYSTANKIYGELHPDSPAYNRLNLQMQDKFLRNFAVYHLAGPLRGIELALVDRRVSFDDLLAVAPDSVGTKLVDIPPPQVQIDPIIDDEKYREMLQKRKEDPSHMIFFGDGYDSLPEIVKYYLEITDANVYVQHLVTSGFKRLYSQVEPPLTRKPSDMSIAEVAEIAGNMPVPKGKTDELIKIEFDEKKWIDIESRPYKGPQGR